MAHIHDLWTTAAPTGRGRVRTDRYGRGRRWQARWYDAGHLRAKSFATRDAAVAHLARIETAHAAGYRDPHTTWADWAATWTARQVHHAPGTAASATTNLARHVTPTLGAMRLTDIRHGDIADLVASWTGVLAPSTQHVAFAHLRSALNAAVRDHIIRTNPCTGVRLPTIIDTPVTPLTVEEVRRIAAAMTPRLQAAVWLAAGTGLRPGEWASLTWDRVDLDAGVARIDRQLGTPASAMVWGPLKTPSSRRVVSLPQAAAGPLLTHRATYRPGPQGLVFSSRVGSPLSRSSRSDAWQVAAARAGVDATGWHQLRHHHASLLIAAGLSPRAVADRLGHASPSETLRTYAHLWGSDDERARSAVDGAFGTVTGCVNGLGCADSAAHSMGKR